MRQHIVILIPVYNDGDCFNILQNALAEKLANPDISYTFLVVNDGSTEPLHIVRNTYYNLRVLHLHRNIGHQKALAIGLAYIQEHIPCNKVLVMDSDGEDRPADALKLLYESDAQPGTIVFAHRGSRQENRGFRIFYSCYKLFFRILTGYRISFGHFMVIPTPLLAKLVHYTVKYGVIYLEPSFAQDCPLPLFKHIGVSAIQEVRK